MNYIVLYANVWRWGLWVKLCSKRRKEPLFTRLDVKLWGLKYKFSLQNVVSVGVIKNNTMHVPIFFVKLDTGTDVGRTIFINS